MLLPAGTPGCPTASPSSRGRPLDSCSMGSWSRFGVDGLPSFPRLCERMLAGHREIPVLFVAFDLAEHGEPVLGLPYRERRRRLEALALNGPCWTTTVVTDDGAGLWGWVCDRGLEGVVAPSVRRVG